MATLLDESRGGDAASAAMAAMLIHWYPEIARQQGLAPLYQSLLAQAVQSKDPELLACLAEELVIGKRLAADARMAHRAITKSNELSGFMGSYVIARLVAAKKPKLALRYLQAGRKSGHIPSIILEHRVKAMRWPRFVRFVWLSFSIPDLFRIWRAIAAKDKRRLWRAMDIFSSASRKKEFLALIGTDRAMPFSRIDALMPSKANANRAAVGRVNAT